MSKKELMATVSDEALIQAEDVFKNKLGIDVSTGINIFLTAVSIYHDIPFPADIERARILPVDTYKIEQDMRAEVQQEID